MYQHQRTSINIALVLATILMLLPTHPLDAANPSSQSIDCQPLVIYDVCGYGYAGRTMLHLAVYSNGEASVSWLGPRGSYAEFTTVPKMAVYDLVAALTAVGGLTLTDRGGKSVDTPMTTVTVFSDNTPNAFHNTFSFFSSGPQPTPSKGRYDEVVRLLQTFIDNSFSHQ